jgi:hypothetical protein
VSIVAASVPPNGVVAAMPALLTRKSNVSRSQVSFNAPRSASANASKVSNAVVSSCSATALRFRPVISPTTAAASSPFDR